MLKVLFIAPLPPPIHGQSLASLVFLNEVKKNNEVIIVNTAKKKAKNSFEKFIRNFEVAKMLLLILRNRDKADIIYLTISQSILGNIKDIFIYIICFKHLSKMTIHLHGGAGMAKLMVNEKGLLFKINTFFVKRLRNIIVLGKSHVPIFENMIHKSEIHIVPNFAEDYLFISEQNLINKFQINGEINILFLSNLLSGKGYMELIDAFIGLDDDLQAKFRLNVAGAFGSPTLEMEFLKKIGETRNIKYHGVVRGEEKKEIFRQSHIFCLPTYYPFEGQPISILEAYATGCAVITTNHSGIRDVFADKKNGFEVEKRSSNSIKRTLKYISENPESLFSLAKHNRKSAEERYRTSIYNATLKKIMKL